ncbi:MAG TPA: PASTA domain-containing protein, partial [Actinoplanes sp.]
AAQSVLADRRRLLLAAAVAVMVLVVIGSTWWVTLGRYTEAPPMLNMTKEQAELYAQQHDFDLSYGDGKYSETIPKNTVLGQDPAAGDRVVRGGTITLDLSLGKERFAVPDLAGLELAAARGDLEQSNLKLKEGKGQYSDTIPEGAVISTDPVAGAQLKRGDTVTVVVSEGRAPITVPDVTGQNINDARRMLQELGLASVERYKDSEQPGNEVIAQSPKAGAGATKDAEVTLDVSNGPAKVTVPDLSGQPCQQAQDALLKLNLRVRVDGIVLIGVVRGMNPGPNTQVPPDSEVTIQCRF